MNYEKEVSILVDFITLEVIKAKKTGCVIGVSGGIDSAVVTALCKKAYPYNTFGIQLPIKSKSLRDSTLRSKELCDKLQMPCYFHPIDDYDSTIIKENTNLALSVKTTGNWYARQRMATLYMYAEMLDCLVIGTDNLSENYIGYFTKYGDGGVDINPIGKYFKSEVYELGRYLEIPDSILNAAPSAELWNDQTDESELGFSYDELEIAINALNGNLVGKFVKPEIIKKVEKMHELTEHKRIIPKEYERNVKC